MPPKKKKQRVKFQSLHDEILFENDESLFERHGVDASLLRNVYTRGCDKGSDRLYYPDSGGRLYAHVNPHLYAWHNNVPSEVMYGSLSKKGLVPPVRGWWLSTTSEIVVLYDSGGTLTPSDSATNPRAAAVDLFSKCRTVLVESAIFPTAFNPKRIFYRPESNEFGFYEAGHFQNTAWYVNESCRIVDSVYAHPTLEMYFPVNAFKARADVLSDSLSAGLLNLYHGTVAFFHNCLLGAEPSTRNSKCGRNVDDSSPRCTTPSGICERIVEEKYRRFFHEQYCVQSLKVLPMLLRKREPVRERVREFVSRYDALLEAIGRLP